MSTIPRRTPRRPRRDILVALLLTAAPADALAQNCKKQGGLVYLGNVAGQTRSVWLSGTAPGSYRLESAQGTQTVDTWSLSGRGLHISTSPFVSSGSGGTHKLYSTDGSKDCLIDTQNQKRKFTLPPINFPPSRPLPPIGNFFPDFGGPPIGTLPPTGMMPTRPGMPTLPGGVTPPIATLPPTGVMPTRPGMPTLPGGVTPPIGTLPPTGVTPTEPGGVVPTPGTAPTMIAARTDIAQPPIPGCPDPGQPGTPIPADAQRRTDCPPPRQQGEPAAVPITPGRELIAESLWNVWSQFNLVHSSDRRGLLDMKASAQSIQVGLDRKLDPDIVAGMLFSLDFGTSHSSGNNILRSETSGFSVGPYFAVRLSSTWALDASLTYGRLKVDQRLAVLDGKSTSETWAGSANLHGQFWLDEVALRPRLSLDFAHVRNGAFGMRGLLLGLPLSVHSPDSNYNTGVVATYVEVNRTFTTAGGASIMPYAELGLLYAFARPFDGRATGGLSPSIPSPWTVTARAGVRAALTPSLLVEAAGGYLSIGQSGLDIWEARFRVSVAF